MDTRNILLAAAGVVVGLIVIVAVLGAGSILLSAVFGGGNKPTATPTSVPASLTPTPYAIIPSGPIGTLTPSSSAYPVVPTPVQPVVKSAELVGHGKDKDTYNRGDTAIAYITIKNTGTVPINEARLHIAVAKYFAVFVPVTATDTTLTDLDIKPGETKKVDYRIDIPSEYQGISTAGRYRFTVTVSIWDVDMDPFTEEAEVN